VNHFEEYRDRTLDEIKRVASFARELPPGVKLAIAPEIEAGVRDLARCRESPATCYQARRF